MKSGPDTQCVESESVETGRVLHSDLTGSGHTEGGDERSSPADSYRLSSPERVPEDTKLRTEETKMAGAELEIPSVPKNLRERRERSK